jgi:CheY-like chemotaxis protein
MLSSSRQSSPSGRSDHSDQQFMRVVIVEDDVRMRSALGSILRGLGAKVLAEIADGQAALERLADKKAEHPDLILTDCQMPRLDGISLVRRLRARGDRTPVIMISGQHEPQIKAMALAAGVSLYLFKPLSTASLQRAIGQTLGGAAA